MADAGYFAQMQATDGWQRILGSFARFVDPPKDAQCLDIGCGAGALVNIMGGIGADADPHAIALAQGQYPQQLFICTALPTLALPSAYFDVITATNVIYLLDDPISALREVGRLLKPNGIFVMLNPSENMSRHAAATLADDRGLTGFARDNFIHWGAVAEQKVRWSADDIANLFEQAGLQLVATQTRIGDGLARYAKGQKNDFAR